MESKISPDETIQILRDARNLIESQQKEIEQLKEQIDRWRDTIRTIRELTQGEY